MVGKIILTSYNKHIERKNSIYFFKKIDIFIYKRYKQSKKLYQSNVQRKT